jgi:unsaturated rhamnogalacturonyl hydrolase
MVYTWVHLFYRYQTTFANGEGLEDIIRQFKLSYQHLIDEKTGLYIMHDEKNSAMGQ